MLRRVLLTFAGISLLLLAAALWLVGSDTGTRWLIQQAVAGSNDSLRVGHSEGDLLSRLRLSDLEFKSPGFALSIESVALEVALSELFSGRLQIDTLQVEGLNVALTESDVAPASDSGELNVPIDVSLPAASIERIRLDLYGDVRDLERVSIDADLTDNLLTLSQLSIEGDWVSVDVAAEYRLNANCPSLMRGEWRLHEPDVGWLVGEIAAASAGPALRFEHRLSSPAPIESSGELRCAASPFAFEVVNQWTPFEWPQGADALSVLAGSLRLAGNLDDYAVEGRSGVLLPSPGEVAIAVRGKGSTKRFDLNELKISNSGTTLQSNGGLTWAPALSGDFSLTARVDEIADYLTVAQGDIRISGRLTVDADAAANGAGQDGVGDPTIHLSVHDIGGTLNGTPITGNADVQRDPGGVVVATANLASASNHLVLSGRLADALQGEAHVKVDALAEVLAGASGSLSLDAQLGGTLEQPTLQLEGEGSGLTWLEHQLQSFSMAAQLDSAGALQATLRANQLALAGADALDATVSAGGSGAGYELNASINAEDYSVRTAAEGALNDGELTGTLKALELNQIELGRWTLRSPVAFEASAMRAELATTCLVHAESGRLCLDVEFAADAATQFNAEVESLPVMALQPLLATSLTLTGTVHGRAEGQWAGQQVDGALSLGWREGGLRVAPEDDAPFVRLSTAELNGSVRANALDANLTLDVEDGAARGNGTIRVADVLDASSELTGRVNLAAQDLAVLERAVPEIESLRGGIDGGLTLAGTVSAPKLSGRIDVRDASLTVLTTRTTVGDLNLALLGDDDGVVNWSGSARLGTGNVSLTGSYDLSGSGDWQLRGEQLELMNLPDWRVVASADLRGALGTERLEVQGTLDVPEARIKVRSVPESAVTPSPDAVVHGAQQQAAAESLDVAVDVAVTFGEAVRFSGFGLKAGLAGELQLNGATASVVTGQGRVALQDGRYKAYGQELDIERGELIFNGPVDVPRIFVRASRTVDDVVAGIELEGVPTQLTSKLYSVPTLSDVDALSYLLTGRPLGGSSSTSEGRALNNAAFALGLSGAGKIASKVRGELGLDTLAIEGDGSDGRLIVGKRIGNRLFVEYGYGLIDSLGTLLLRYQLAERLVLESRSGETSSLDLLYSIKRD